MNLYYHINMLKKFTNVKTSRLLSAKYQTMSFRICFLGYTTPLKMLLYVLHKQQFMNFHVGESMMNLYISKFKAM